MTMTWRKRPTVILASMESDPNLPTSWSSTEAHLPDEEKLWTTKIM